MAVALEQRHTPKSFLRLSGNISAKSGYRSRRSHISRTAILWLFRFFRSFYRRGIEFGPAKQPNQNSAVLFLPLRPMAYFQIRVAELGQHPSESVVALGRGAC